MMGGESYSFTDLPNNVTTGRYCSIASGGFFQQASRHLYQVNKKVVFTFNWDQPEGLPITFGNDVWMGHGVQVLEGVNVGDGAILGAGAVISKDVPPFAVVVGNPQRILRYRFTPSQIKALQRIKWWDWDKETALSRKEDMKDIKEFIKKYDLIETF